MRRAHSSRAGRRGAGRIERRAPARRPLGNGADTNANGADFVVRALADPQNLAARRRHRWPSPPTPVAGADAVPDARPSTAGPDAAPRRRRRPSRRRRTPVADADRPTPVPTPTAHADAVPDADARRRPRRRRPTSPTPTPTPTPTPDAHADADADPITIADARLLADGPTSTIRGVLTTGLGALESARIGFVQDASAGIASGSMRRSSTPIAAGTVVEIPGAVVQLFQPARPAADGSAIAVAGSSGAPRCHWPRRPARRASRSKASA